MSQALRVTRIETSPLIWNTLRHQGQHRLVRRSDHRRVSSVSPIRRRARPRSSTRLLQAGAIPLGKTNLDQFATGLSGTRSPYGACRNSFDAAFIAGGSSSGSAVAVATGTRELWLGHRYRGLRPGARGIQQRRRPQAEPRALEHPRRRARVPLAGLRIDFRLDRRGRRSRARCRRRIRRRGSVRPASREPRRVAQVHRFGVPRREQLQFFGDSAYARLFETTVQRLRELGACTWKSISLPSSRRRGCFMKDRGSRNAMRRSAGSSTPIPMQPSRSPRRSSPAGKRPRRSKPTKRSTGSWRSSARARPPGRQWI